LHESGVLAASPDGIVVRPPAIAVHEFSSAEPQLIEVKCPFASRDLTVLEAVKSKDFFLGMNWLILDRLACNSS
jgi:hypothetical protein